MGFIFQLKQGFNFFLDLLFPIECLGCGKEGIWLCEQCFQKIPLNNKFNCLICQRPSLDGRVCFLCQKDSWLDSVWVAGDYDNPVLQRAIKTFKYRYIADLAEPLSRFLLKDKKSLDSFDLIIPVPLHKKRFLERGFNQSELLARCLVNSYSVGDFSLPVSRTSAKGGSAPGGKVRHAERADVPTLAHNNILKRQRHTSPQVNLKGQARQVNIKGAFVCLNPKSVKNKKIILVDDVFTTGATLQECARVLKLAGAKEVWGLVLARG